MLHWTRVYSSMMWFFRILKWLFRLWFRAQVPQGKLVRLAGSYLIDRILKNLQSDTEKHSDIRGRATRENRQQTKRVNHYTIPPARNGVLIGMYLLGVLVLLSLIILVPLLWLK